MNGDQWWVLIMTELISEWKFKNAKLKVNMFLWCLTEQCVFKDTHVLLLQNVLFSFWIHTLMSNWQWCKWEGGRGLSDVKSKWIQMHGADTGGVWSTEHVNITNSCTCRSIASAKCLQYCKLTAMTGVLAVVFRMGKQNSISEIIKSPSPLIFSCLNQERQKELALNKQSFMGDGCGTALSSKIADLLIV